MEHPGQMTGNGSRVASTATWREGTSPPSSPLQETAQVFQGRVCLQFKGVQKEMFHFLGMLGEPASPGGLN